MTKEEHAGKWKIYYEQLDENGQVIGRGVYCKDYVNYGNAINVARKRYGDRTKFRYIVARRNPWKEYHATLRCRICKKDYDCAEDCNGSLLKNQRVSITSWDTTVTPPKRTRDNIIFGDVCPECHGKVLAYVKSLMPEDGNA